jgi:hypothetical protein
MPGVEGRTGAGAAVAAAAAAAAGAAAAGAAAAGWAGAGPVGAGDWVEVGVVAGASAEGVAVCAWTPPAPITAQANGAAKNSFFIEDSPAVNHGLRFDSIRLTIVEILKARAGRSPYQLLKNSAYAYILRK